MSTRVYAKFVHPDYGYDRDQERAKELLKINEVYEVDNISMGQSSTSIYLKEVPGPFNSVHFDFYDKDDMQIDIYSMPEFNPYLRKIDHAS